MKRRKYTALERKAWLLAFLVALVAVSACVYFRGAWHEDVLWHMSNYKATCNYVQKYMMLQSKELREELLAQISFGCPPQEIDWVFNPRLSSLPDEYLFKDEHSPDIQHLETQYPTTNAGKDWFMAHFSVSYPLLTDKAPAPPYTLSFSGSDGVDVTTDSVPNHWVYIVSKEAFPSHYAVEFDFWSGTRIKEQLQLCFHADSLAERRRFILEYGEKVFFQIVSQAFFMEPLKSTPAVNRPGEWVHIRMEVTGNQAFYYMDDHLQISVDLHELPRQGNRFMIIFWNADERKPIETRIRRFKVYTLSQQPPVGRETRPKIEKITQVPPLF